MTHQLYIMRVICLLFFVVFSNALVGQTFLRYDSTMKIGKAGFRISCLNRSADKNIINIRPLGFKSEAREVALELKGRIVSGEIDDLNNDGFPDALIYILGANGKGTVFCVSSQKNESLAPIYFPDISNDLELSKGYRGEDEFKLVEGILFRKFPIYTSDTANKIPTNKVRQIMYRVIEDEKSMWKFKSFKNFDLGTGKE